MAAARVFAFEINSAGRDLITAKGLKISKVFFVGVLVEKRRVKDFWLLRVADPTGSIRAYVKGDVDAEPSCLVGILGRVRIIGRRPVVRVEAMNVVDRETYMRWLLEALMFAQERGFTVERVERLLEEVEQRIPVYEIDMTVYLK